MGVSIHYHGAINANENYINEILKKATKYLSINNFIDYKLISNFKNKNEKLNIESSVNSEMVPTNYFSKNILYTPRSLLREPIKLNKKRSLVANLHPNCEAFILSFYKNKNNNIWIIPCTSVKTQFSPPWTHVLICNILKNVELMMTQKGGIFSINDESNYYYSNDIGDLIQSMRQIDKFIGTFAHSISDHCK